MKIGEEKIIQFKIVDWLRSKHPEIPFWANVNEQQCSIMWRRILSRMGFLGGVSDLIFPRGNQTFKGLVLELKTEKGKAQESQKDFIKMMIQEGYTGHFSYGYNEAILIIKNFYSLSE